MTWTTRQRSDLGGIPVIRAGTGPTVVLLHGVGLRAEAWNAQIDALATMYEVIAPDMPGHGAAPVTEGLELAGYTDRVAGMVSGPSLIVGHSMGAMIALDLAVRYPAKVAGIAALNAIYRRDDAAARAVQARADDLDGVTNPDPTQPLMRWFGDNPSPARDACENWLRGVSPAGYQQAYRVFARADAPSDAALSALHCPALFMTGGLEPNSTPSMSQAMAALVPQGQAIIVDDAAHMMPMTHPQTVNDALMAFAEEVFT